MTLITIGDSITRGTYTAPQESSPNSIASPTFSQLLQIGLGADKLINYGKNGVSVSALSPVMTEHAFSQRWQETENADIILIAAGTNDFGTNVPLGEASDCTDVSFYGALDVLFCGLRQKNPHAEIYAVTPLHRKGDQANALGIPLSKYAQAIFQKAIQNDIIPINGFDIPIDPNTEEHCKLYAKDGVHPNAEGHRIYAKALLDFISQARRNKKGDPK